ncbi:hypothetical protein B566_EDAN013959 [Ephemera danica]|nr:hypothetical protein B566_EDAN013959 [Ephemera danica]
MKMLELGYMADITIKIKDSKFRCHKNILGISSPNFAALFREQPKTLQLKNIDPNHFRFLLDNDTNDKVSGVRSDYTEYERGPFI